MNFTETIKDEIIKKNSGQKCCKKAFLAGFIRSTGSIVRSGGNYGFMCSTETPSAAEYAARLIKALYGYEGAEIFASEDKLNKKTRVDLECIGDKPVEILFDLGIIAYDEEGAFELRLKSNRDLLKKECCKKAFIKGMFLGSGHCTVPNNSSATGYHLEVVFTHNVPASDFAEYLAEFGIIAKTIVRRRSVVVYIKSAEEISDFLALIGCPSAVLKLTEKVVEKQLNNRINRQKNCDLANVNKQVEALEKYSQAINLIASTVGLFSLSEELRSAAEARINYPDDTLSELAERLNVSKSCLNHRLRRLVAIADEL